MGDFNLFAGRYSEDLDRRLSLMGANAAEFARQKASWLRRLSERHLGPTQHLKILDLGCGPGNVSLFLKSSFGEVVGADVSLQLIEDARNSVVGVSFLHIEPGPLPFADAEFDVAFCAGVFHHLKDSELPGVCAEMARVVKPGGLVVIFEHNPINPLTRKLVQDCDLDWDVDRLLPQRQTIALLRGAGLDTVATDYISFFAGFLKKLRPLERWWGWCPLGAQYLVAAQKARNAPRFSEQPEFSLVLPMYNESENIFPVSKALLDEFVGAGVDFELILVDNGSRDDTGDQIRALQAQRKEVQLVSVDKNQGYGWGVISGLWSARGKVIGYTSGDGQVSAEDVLRTYKRYLEGDWALTKVTRVVRQDGWNRVLITTIYNSLFRVMFGLPSKDVNGSPKIFAGELLPRLNLEQKDWFLDAEVYLKLAALGKVSEVPVDFHPRQQGRSNVRVSTLVEFLLNMIRFRISSLFRRNHSARR